MTTLLVAHGALGSAAQMQPLVDALSARGQGLWHVRPFEFPGHGATPLDDPERFSLPAFADALHDAVRALDDAPFLLGYSMGGYVGLAVEARTPGTFRGIVTLGTKFEWTPALAEREASRLDPAVIATKVPRFAEALAARHADAGGWEAVLLRTAHLLRANAAAPLLTVDLLERIAIPVCVAVGSADDTVSADESRAAADMMLHARCEVLDGVPHPIERVPTAMLADLAWSLFQSHRPATSDSTN